MLLYSQLLTLATVIVLFAFLGPATLEYKISAAWPNSVLLSTSDGSAALRRPDRPHPVV